MKKFYKAFPKTTDLNDIIGNTYRVPKDANVSIYNESYRCVENIGILIRDYVLSEMYNICEVFVRGKVIYDSELMVYRVEEITVFRQLNEDEINELYDKHLEDLIDSDDENIRALVAKHSIKKYLDRLINDESPIVRRAVAEYGDEEHLNVLVYDPDFNVQEAVAERGIQKYLTKVGHFTTSVHVLRIVAALSNDKEILNMLKDYYDWMVRYNLACRGLFSNHYLNDKNEFVRSEAARFCSDDKLYLLDNDKSEIVQSIIRKRRYNYTR